MTIPPSVKIALISTLLLLILAGIPILAFYLIYRHLRKMDAELRLLIREHGQSIRSLAEVVAVHEKRRDDEEGVDD